MKWLIGIAIVFALIALWVVWGRPWLRDKSWAQGFFAWIEPIEIKLWSKSETIFKARAMMVVGVLITVLTQAGAVNILPLMPFVPDAWEPILTVLWNSIPLTLTVLGMIDEKLRKDTTKPLELVAVAERDVTPKMIEAEEAKVEAVAEVKAEEVRAEAAAADKGAQ